MPGRCVAEWFTLLLAYKEGSDIYACNGRKFVKSVNLELTNTWKGSQTILVALVLPVTESKHDSDVTRIARGNWTLSVTEFYLPSSRKICAYRKLIKVEYKEKDVSEWTNFNIGKQ